MDRQLIGRAALVLREIERLKRDIDFHSSLEFYDSTVKTKDNEQLAKLQTELSLESVKSGVVVFGTVHKFQMMGDKNNPELEKRLSFLINKFSVTTLMEEWTESQPPSYLNELAMKRLLPYKNVAPPPEGKFRSYENHDVRHPSHEGALGPCDDAPAMSEYGPIENHENRERQMIRNVRSQMENHKVGLVVVGLAHLHSVSIKLGKASFSVSAYSWLG
jgi:hypothetical protein